MRKNPDDLPRAIRRLSRLLNAAQGIFGVAGTMPRSAWRLLCFFGTVSLLLVSVWPRSSTKTVPHEETCAYFARDWAQNWPTVIVATKTVPSFRISLHPEEYDPLRWTIAKKGYYYDTSLTRLTQKLLLGRSSSVVVDVGANIGWLSLYAMALGHKVHSFEPNSRNIARLCQSIEENNFQHLAVLHHAGVGAEDGSLTLRQPKNPGAATVWTNVSSRELVYEEKVNIVTLSGTMHEDATLLKIDVEGYEGHVLRGAHSWLRQFLVTAIYVELNPASLTQQGFSPAVLIEDLFELGYQLHFASFTKAEANLTQSSRIIAEKCSANTQCDLLFCRHRCST